MVGMFAIMYFLVIRPQQKQKRERETLLARDQEGRSGRHHRRDPRDGGGAVDEHTVTLQVGDQVKLDFDRGAIGRIVPAAGDKESSA